MLTLHSGRMCETYKEVCCELGLLNDDQEWHKVLEESALTNMCPQLRELFSIILLFCMASDPLAMFNDFWETWYDDFEHKFLQRGIQPTQSQLKTMVLLDLEVRLASHGKRLTDFELPVPTVDEMAQVNHITCTQPVIIREELDFNFEDLQSLIADRVPTFTLEQKYVFDRIMKAVKDEESFQCFIDARGGCGKTYLLNTVLAAVRISKPGGCPALAMATTGIAANLLDLGRTFHSRLKAPLDPTENSTLAISGQSNLAELIRMSKLILIDESTMLDRYMLEAMDRSFRDIMRKPNYAFGGKVIILSGDFRQCLPVVPGATRPGIVKHSINQSHLWGNFTHLTLTVNMRVHASGNQELEDFDRWTQTIGNGEMESLSIPEEMIATKISPNTKKDSTAEGAAMKDFCEKIFPNIAVNAADKNWLDGRAILASTNTEVTMLNDLINDMLPGNNQVFRSADELDISSEDILRFTTEYLNSLNPSGIPPHLLNLKPGMPLMLLRNLNPREGLCNGTKLVFEKSLDNKVLQCREAGS